MKLRLAPLALWLGAGLACASAHATANSLPDPVSAALKRAHIPPSHVGVVVQQVDAPGPLIALNGGQPMNPASTMKLLTTFAGLETLGPAYRWKTEAYLNGKLENGVLQGDLVFKGYGDPKLTVEQFWMWLRELRQRGLREIRGDIVLDHGFFEDATQAADFDSEPNRAYNVGTNALLLNFNAVHLHLVPNGSTAIALLDPDMEGYTLQNNLTTSTRLRCRAADAYTIRLDGRVIKLDGRIPANCGEQDDYFSLLPHDEYFFAVFGALWRELGGSIQGKLRTGTAPVAAAPFATYVSPQLSEIIRDINKFSNNIMARQLFLTLGTANTSMVAVSPVPAMPGDATPGDASPGDANPGDLDRSGDQSDSDASGAQADAAPAPAEPAPVPAAPPPGAPSRASIARSVAKMRQWLQTHQLQFPELVLENGSGLSRKERISALHLASLLQQATHSPFSAELEASLPILGMDGTVKKRFKDSDLAGHAHLKTGTLDGVKAMAGYVDAPSGKKWIVVFIINHPNAARGQAAQDALIRWVQMRNP